MRIVRFGPFRPGCWYDLIDARADDDGNITCPECGRVLDASKSKLFRRRKPRLKLATACVVLMMGALGTSVYVVATSPSWVKVLPDVALAVMFNPESIARGSASQMQRTLMQEIERRAMYPASRATRLLLHPKLERLVRAADSQEVFAGIVQRLDLRGEFLADELIDYIDRTNPMSISPSWAQNTVYWWLTGTRSPKVIDAAERWMQSVPTGATERDMIEATGKLVVCVKDNRAVRFLLDIKPRWDAHGMSRQWRFICAQCVLFNAPLPPDIAPDVIAALSEDEKDLDFVDIRCAIKMIKSNKTTESFWIDGIASGMVEAKVWEEETQWIVRSYAMPQRVANTLLDLVHSEQESEWRYATNILHRYAFILTGKSSVFRMHDHRWLTAKERDRYINSLEHAKNKTSDEAKIEAIDSVLNEFKQIFILPPR